ncbi:MAG: PAS domain-containing protein, partial [Cyclonatronaceae bacterium]
MEHTTSVSYKKIIHASPFGYASYRRIKSDTGQTVDIEFTDMNPAFSRISGLQPEHVIGKRLSQLLKQPRFRKHDLLGLNNARRLYARQFMEDRWEYYATRQDIRYLAHIYAADSHIMVLMLTPCSDIEIDTSAFSTRRHHMVCRFKPDTTLTFVNKAYCQNVGRAAIKLIGRSFLDLVPRD